MYLVVGLGNPGKQYEATRHNMGFDTINKLANEYNIKINKNKFKGLCGSGIIENEKVILLKPQTYMNLSGESIKEAMAFYKIKSENIIVIYDDIDIEPGIIKIRKKGGPGGHNVEKHEETKNGSIDHLYFGSWLSGCMALCCTKKSGKGIDKSWFCLYWG